MLVDGRNHVVAGRENGFFVGGTLFDHVTPDMRIYKEEIFGPVLCVMRAPDVVHAVNLINANEYGNGVAIYTRDGGSYGGGSNTSGASNRYSYNIVADDDAQGYGTGGASLAQTRRSDGKRRIAGPGRNQPIHHATANPLPHATPCATPAPSPSYAR